MFKPNVQFFVPGFSKCGTTTLCSLLGDHPEIYIPEIKEPNFFSMAYHRGWEWYADLFSKAAGRIGGEGSTFYTAKNFEDFAVSKMAEFYPDAKFIFIARNPFTRIESSYREHHHSGHKYGVHVPHDLEQTLRAFPNILDDTSYWSRLEAYRKRFDDQQIHILFFEDLLANQQFELRKCFKFLGADPEVQIENPKRQLNPGSQKRYDTVLMRRIRTSRIASKAWSLIPENRRLLLEDNDLLRKPFAKKIQWPSQTKRFVLGRLAEESAQFLEYAGKPVDYWDLSIPATSARAMV
ncbi:sulfotransferase family protein [Mariniblastus fucicola]|nr:sulfotransferase [Mariniblastus fucicola]